MEDKKINWYALYTKPRWEKKVAKLLKERGIEHYCPLNRVVRQWSDRKKVIFEPVFKSYVFVRIEDQLKWELKKVDGVLNFVYWLGRPAVVKDEEIINIQKFLNEFDDVKMEKVSEINVNSRVRVKQGIMMNYQGMLIEVNGNRAKVRIETMGVYLNAMFDKRNLELAGKEFS